MLVNMLSDCYVFNKIHVTVSEQTLHPLVKDAIKAGLSMHVFPLCEISSLPWDKDPDWRNRVKDQMQLLFSWGADGVFGNQVDIGIEA